jgi:hypothetical protein
MSLGNSFAPVGARPRIPGPAASAAEAAMNLAVALFVVRARAHRLDGLPPAIELATSHARTLREVEHYRNPSGGTVELPNHYRPAWKLRDGSCVLTDSPAFDPGRDLGVAGEKLQLAPR